MPLRILRYLPLLFILSICSLNLLAQNQSVFAEDSCAPPCWFGLTAGESTTADVESLIEQYAIEAPERFGEYNPESNLLSNGVYEFTFLTRETSTVFVEIQIRDSLVHRIFIRPTVPINVMGEAASSDEYITMEHVLDRLGEPADIYFYRSGLLYADTVHVTFVYSEL